jgi:peptidoglycan-N-acetylglucosamine deacetylase
VGDPAMNRFSIRPRLGCGVFAVALLPIAAALWAAPEWVVDGLARLHPGCLFRVRTEEALLALTIDDGPTSLSTPIILSQLKREQARATFFLLADQVPGREHLVRRMIAEGHEIGNHFTKDRASIRLSEADFEADLLRADSILSRFQRLRWARPGSGWYSSAMVGSMQRNGYRCALGSVYPFDAAIPSVSFAASYILRNAQPGAVVVMHDGEERGLRTARILQRVLPELRRKGFRFVTLSELTEGR